MASREDLGSWLEGAPRDARHPGERLGVPAAGPGSMAALGRRVAALCVDWALAMAVSAGFFGLDPWATLGVFALENLLLVGLLGHTIGHRLVGLHVRPLDGGSVAPGLGRAAIRTALLCLVIPPVVWDADGRGLHDRAAGTLIVRR